MFFGTCAATTIALCFYITNIYAEDISGNNKDRVQPVSGQIQLTQKERDWLIKHPVIHYAIDPFWAPIEYLGENDEPQGISVEYLKQLEQLLGIRFEYVSGFSWEEAQEKLQLHEIDVMPAVSKTAFKQNLFNFTDPYLSTPNAIFSSTDSTYIGGVDALKQKRVIVVKDYSIEYWLREKHTDINLLTAPTPEAAIAEVAAGNAFAFIGNLITTSYYIGRSGLTQMRVAGETSFYNNLGIAVRKDWELFPGILQKGLDAIPETERNSIYHSWISIKYKHSVDYSLVWMIIGIASLILLSILYWNRRLVSEIERRLSAEAELHRAKQKAEIATQAKSEFLRNMSHEIRTPMNAVIGIGYLFKETKLTRVQTDYLQKLMTSSQSLLTTIDNVLDFSKGESNKLSLDTAEFSLVTMLTHLKNGLEPLISNKDIELLVPTTYDIPDQLIGDSHKILQVMINLGANAIKFTEKGSIHISVEPLECVHDKVVLCFRVKDSGIGIPKEQQPKLFKPFSQGDSSTTRRFGGTGLGLSISNQLANLMKGTIALESSSKSGSCFTFTVALQIAQSQSCHMNECDSSETTGDKLIKVPGLKNNRVLIVDDDELNVFLIKAYLEAFDVKIEIANNGLEALEQMNSKHFDLVLMDIQMPIMDGFEATREIRNNQQWSDLPVVAMTAHALESEKNRSVAVGINDYLTKPIQPAQLKNILIKWLS